MAYTGHRPVYVGDGDSRGEYFSPVGILARWGSCAGPLRQQALAAPAWKH